jgi:hypothetical protein
VLRGAWWCSNRGRRFARCPFKTKKEKMVPPYPHQHGAVRFAPGEFRHNVRAAAALVPALAVVALLGGRPVAAVLTVGAMVWYLLDAMGLREGSLTAVRKWRRAKETGSVCMCVCM